MSDEQKPIVLTNVSYARIKPIAIDPVMQERVSNAINKAAEKAIYESMGIPSELLVEKANTWMNKQSLRQSMTLELKHDNAEVIEYLKRLFETPYNKFCREWVEEMNRQQVHESLISKHQYVFEYCRKDVVDLIKSMTITEAKDINWFSEQLLELYKKATS